MKKLLSVCLGVMVLLVCLCVPISATSTEPDDFVTITYGFDTPIDLKAGSIDIVYDHSALEIVSGEWLLDPMPEIAGEVDPATDKAVFSYLSTHTVYGDVLMVTFRVIHKPSYDSATIVPTFRMQDYTYTDIPGIEDHIVTHVYDRELPNPEYFVSGATCASRELYYKSCSCGCEGASPNGDTFGIGQALPHTFDAEVIAPEHLASEASCQSPALYYISCSVCGANSTDTFEYGSILPHSYDREVADDAFLAVPKSCTEKNVYYKSCVCGGTSTETFVSEIYGHTFDRQVADGIYLASEATCNAKATYYLSCECGEKGTETFEYGEKLNHSWITQNGTAVCALCGAVMQGEGNDNANNKGNGSILDRFDLNIGVIAIIAGVAALVVIGVGVLIAILVIKSKSKKKKIKHQVAPNVADPAPISPVEPEANYEVLSEEPTNVTEPEANYEALSRDTTIAVAPANYETFAEEAETAAEPEANYETFAEETETAAEPEANYETFAEEAETAAEPEANFETFAEEADTAAEPEANYEVLSDDAENDQK